MKRIGQINGYFCGPATLEMLLSFQGISTSQDALVDASGIRYKIQTHGMVLPEMAIAINRLFPECQFWYKRDSNLTELSHLVNDIGYPAGVEWQGDFTQDKLLSKPTGFEDDEDEDEDEDEDYDYDDDEEKLEGEDDDPGHYGVITGISTNENWVTLADPYKNIGIDKQYSVVEFERRWWDINEIIDPKTGKRKEIDDYHVIFIVTKKTETFPDTLGMMKY